LRIVITFITGWDRQIEVKVELAIGRVEVAPLGVDFFDPRAFEIHEEG
jgi:hypothetical protein